MGEVAGSQPGMTVTLFQHPALPSEAAGPVKCRVHDKDRMPSAVPRRALSSVLSITSLHTSPGGLERQAGSSAGTREQEDTNASFPVTKALLIQGQSSAFTANQHGFNERDVGCHGCHTTGHVLEVRFRSTAPSLCQLGELALSEPRCPHP